jgi:hypothetical protein
MSAQPTLFTPTDRRQWAKEFLEQLREEYHTLRLEDPLTVRRTLQELAREDA